MNRLTIKINRSEVKTLVQVIGHILTSTDITILKRELPEDYLMFSCVYDFFHRLDLKHREIEIHGYPGQRAIKMTMKRHEAIAFFLLTTESQTLTGNDEDDVEEGEYMSYMPALPNLTLTLIRTIRGEIHKQFLV